MKYRWEDLAEDFRAFLLNASAMRALYAERSDPYEWLVELWFPGTVDPMRRQFIVDAVLGTYSRKDVDAFRELCGGPIFEMNDSNRLWVVRSYHENT